MSKASQSRIVIRRFMNKNDKEQILSKYLEIKREVDEKSAQLEELKGVIKTVIGAGQYGSHLVILTDSERKSFDFKMAAEVLTPQIYTKYITPCLKYTQYQTLKVTKIESVDISKIVSS